MHRHVLALPIALLLLSAPAPAASAQASSTDAAEAPAFMKVSGDVRFRYELDTREGDNVDEAADSRTRPRLRARVSLGSSAPVKGVSLGMRLATNPGTPGNSPHQDLQILPGGGIGHVMLIDRAFVRYAHEGGLSFTAGKFGFPFWQQTEQFWDEDIQPEGVHLGWSGDLGGAGSLSVSGGYWYIVSNGWQPDSFTNDAAGTWGLKYGTTLGSLRLTLGVTGLHVMDPGAATNTDGSVEVGDASFFTAALQAKTTGMSVNLVAGVDVLMSDVSDDAIDDAASTGFVAQLRATYDRFGFRYYFYDVGESSAPFFATSTFAQDNFANSRGGGLTGFSGHRVQLDYRLSKSFAADFRAYLQEGKAENVLALSEVAGRSINRFQANLNARF